MQKRISNYLSCVVLICLSCCGGTAQPDFTKLTDQQWQEDLDYLSNRITKSFAGFTPETRTLFANEVRQLSNTLNVLTVPEKILGMTKLLAILHDGHTEVSLVGASSGFRRFPI